MRLHLFGWIAVVGLVVSATTAEAKPPKPDKNETDHGKSWYFFLIEGLKGTIEEFETKYTAAGSPVLPLCWDKPVEVKPLPTPSINSAVAFVCEQQQASIDAVDQIMLDTALSASTGGQLTKEMSATSPCTGKKCTQHNCLNNCCTRYTCWGQSQCHHFGIPCLDYCP